MKLIVDIQVSNLDRAIKFYTDCLGLLCRVKAKDWAAISIGNAEIHLYLHSGLNGHVEFYVDDIDLQVETLRKKDIKFISGMHKPQSISVDENLITTFPWGRTAFFKDSEGNELAIVKET